MLGGKIIMLEYTRVRIKTPWGNVDCFFLSIKADSSENSPKRSTGRKFLSGVLNNKVPLPIIKLMEKVLLTAKGNRETTNHTSNEIRGRIGMIQKIQPILKQLGTVPYELQFSKPQTKNEVTSFQKQYKTANTTEQLRKIILKCSTERKLKQALRLKKSTNRTVL